MWTEFEDMNSGGEQKEKWPTIYIEAPEEEAKVIFYNRFRHNPERVTCTCCGSDYLISSEPTLEQLTGFDRNCRALETPRVNGTYKQPDDPWFKEHYYLDGPAEEREALGRGWKISDSFHRGTWIPFAEYRKSKNVLFIAAEEIKPEERTGTVPDQGYVWVD